MPNLFETGPLHAEDLGAFDDYTPVLTASTTSPTLGSGATQTGAWMRLGPLWVWGWAQFQFGSGMNAGSGTYEISLPFEVDTSAMNVGTTAATATVVGSAVMSDDDTAANRTTGAVILRTSTTLRILGAPGGTGVSHNNPFTWASGDGLGVEFRIQIPRGASPL